MKVKILTHTPDPELLVAIAAKNCYSSSSIAELTQKQTEESVNSFIDYLSEVGHKSPLEHASFTFAIEGVSRSLLAQITRHRIASFSVQSQRYVNVSDFKYVVPEPIKNNQNALRIFESTMDKDIKAYNEIFDYLISEHLFKRYNNIGCPCDSLRYFYLSVKTYVESNGTDGLKKQFKIDYNKAEKFANENARAVLPSAATTNIVMTMNARSLLHFFELRCCNRAQGEIRELADLMLYECKSIAPRLFGKAGAKCTHGTCSEGSMCCGNPRKESDYCTDE